MIEAETTIDFDADVDLSSSISDMASVIENVYDNRGEVDVTWTDCSICVEGALLSQDDIYELWEYQVCGFDCAPPEDADIRIRLSQSWDDDLDVNSDDLEIDDRDLLHVDPAIREAGFVFFGL